MQMWEILCVNALTGLYLIATISMKELKERLIVVSMPSRAYTSLLPKREETFRTDLIRVNALTGLYLIATSSPYYTYSNQRRCVNALTGLYLIATKSSLQRSHPRNLVSMPSRAYTSLLPLSVSVEIHCMIRCQCPHGLVPHFYAKDGDVDSLNTLFGVNALTG